MDEAYGQFAPWSALELHGPAHPGLVVTRTFSKTWAMAGARLGYLVADPVVVSACEAVVLPDHLSVQTQVAGLLALRHVPEMEARVASITEERGRVRPHWPICRFISWPSDAIHPLSSPWTVTPTKSGAHSWSIGSDPGLRQHGKACAGACASRSERRRRTTVFRTRPRRACEHRCPPRHRRACDEGDDGRRNVAGGRFWPYRGQHRIAVLRSHDRRTRPACLLRSTVKAQGDLHVDARHTVEDVCIVGGCLERLLGDKAGVAASLPAAPLDEVMTK